MKIRSLAKECVNYFCRFFKIGNYWYWRKSSDFFKNGVSVSSLVYPFRKDILIRRDFLLFYIKNKRIYQTDFNQFLKLAKKQPYYSYYRWYKNVFLVRAYPQKEKDWRWAKKTYRSMVRNFIELYKSIEKNGFNKNNKIEIKTGKVIIPPIGSEKTQHNYFIGDGCHRLACLMVLGYKTIPAKYIMNRHFVFLKPINVSFAFNKNNKITRSMQRKNKKLKRQYQQIVLPDGSVISGIDRSKTAQIIFPKNFNNKSLLDIGCDIGYFLHEARRRGAGRVVGVENNKAPSILASKLARELDSNIQIIKKSFLDYHSSDQFDYILALNVLHHFPDPIKAVQHLAKMSKGIVVFEFCVAGHHLHRPSDLKTIYHKIFFLTINQIRSVVLRLIGYNEPIVIIGDRPFHRTFYFSPKAFSNLFKKQLAIFSEIRYVKSPIKNRIIAYCKK